MCEPTSPVSGGATSLGRAGSNNRAPPTWLYTMPWAMGQKVLSWHFRAVPRPAHATDRVFHIWGEREKASKSK